MPREHPAKPPLHTRLAAGGYKPPTLCSPKGLRATAQASPSRFLLFLACFTSSFLAVVKAGPLGTPPRLGLPTCPRSSFFCGSWNKGTACSGGPAGWGLCPALFSPPPCAHPHFLLGHVLALLGGLQLVDGRVADQAGGAVGFDLMSLQGGKRRFQGGALDCPPTRRPMGQAQMTCWHQGPGSILTTRERSWDSFSSRSRLLSTTSVCVRAKGPSTWHRIKAIRPETHLQCCKAGRQ